MNGIEAGLSLGSNLDDRLANLRAARAAIAAIPEVTLLASIFQRRLVAAFVVTVLGVAIITGLLMQLLQNAGLIVFA